MQPTHSTHDRFSHEFSMQIRDAHPPDFTRILQLNEESVHFLSPLPPDRLAQLHQEAAYHRVLEIEGRIVAFLLAFREAAHYDSSNYQWFAARFDRFLYIDRVVVSKAHQGHGIGHRFYQDLFLFAQESNADLVTCEYDIDPPNEQSRRFHQRFGFKEVGMQLVGADRKSVSLQAVSLPQNNRSYPENLQP